MAYFVQHVNVHSSIFRLTWMILSAESKISKLLPDRLALIEKIKIKCRHLTDKHSVASSGCRYFRQNNQILQLSTIKKLLVSIRYTLGSLINQHLIHTYIYLCVHTKVVYTLQLGRLIMYYTPLLRKHTVEKWQKKAT